MKFSLLKQNNSVIILLWVMLGLVYGVQHYFSYSFDGYSCNFLGTIFGQMPNFLVWGFVAVFAFQFEKGNFGIVSKKIRNDLNFLKTVCLVFCLHLLILFTVNWIVHGGSFQSTIIDYQNRYVFGWLYFQLLAYSIIIGYYAPTLRLRLLYSIVVFRSKKYLEYFDLHENKVRKRIHLKDIETINANDYYIELRDGQRKHLIRTSLKEVEKKIDPNCFIRIHRSTMVNLMRVEKVFFDKNSWYVKTRSGSLYPISRSRKESVLARLKRSENN